MYDYDMSFGERLKDSIRKTGLNQKSLSLELGVSVATVSQWCADRNYPNIPILIKISETCSVSLDWLLNGRNLSQGIETTEQEKELLKLWGSLSESEKLDAIFYLSRLSRSSNVAGGKGTVLGVK